MFKIVFINSLEFPFDCRCIFAGWQECIYHWNYHKLIYGNLHNSFNSRFACKTNYLGCRQLFVFFVKFVFKKKEFLEVTLYDFRFVLLCGVIENALLLYLFRNKYICVLVFGLDFCT